MNSSTLTRLGDVVVFVNGDRSANYPKGADYVLSGIPFVNAADIVFNRLDLSSAAQISEEAFARLRSGKIEQGDVLYCLRGSIGKMAFVHAIERGAIASSLVIIRATPRIDRSFLYYFLACPSTQLKAFSFDNGSAQPNLSVKSISGLTLLLPSLADQKAIGAVLRALDDKIELNRRMNETLEAMAQAIFKD
jgi:type I restriction enzyme, S subunit